MKWKSVSPDVKRRESPKFKKEQNYQNYNYNPSKLSYYNYDNDYEYGAPLYRSEYSTRQPRPHEDYYYEDRENYYNTYNNNSYNATDGYMNSNFENYNDRNNFSTSVKRSTNTNFIEEDDEEDELYFYGGRNKNKKISSFKDEEYVQVPEVVEEEEDFEYDPADFESEEEVLSSSWTSDSEVEEEFMTKRSKKKIVNSSNTTIKVKSKQHQNPVIIGTIKPKAYAPKIVDLDAATVIKLPPNPLPDTWAHLVQNPLKRIKDKCKEILTSSIEEKGWLKGLKMINPVQGILMRPPFDPETFTIKQWAKFMQKILPVVMDDGYLFVWVEREELAGVIRAAEEYLSFKYVENLCWIRRDLGNRLSRELPASKPALFYKSKMTLLILRRDPRNQCKLRHQRNPDCIFDFVGPERMPDGRVYDVIEMLLDGNKFNGPHLMHLWAGTSDMDRLVYGCRKHWIRVLEVQDQEYLESVEDVMEIAKETGVESKSDNVGVIADITPISEDSFTTYNEIIKDIAFGITSTHLDHSEPRANDTVVVTEMLDLPPNNSITDSISTAPSYPQDILMIPSSTFDEDFCNFITCEPVI